MSMEALIEAWRFDLPATDKMVAVFLANVADENGANVYPSIAYVAYHTGIAERTVRKKISAFVETGGLVRVAPATNRKPAEYRFDYDKFPRLDRWQGLDHAGRKSALDARRHGRSKSPRAVAATTQEAPRVAVDTALGPARVAGDTTLGWQEIPPKTGLGRQEIPPGVAGDTTLGRQEIPPTQKNTQKIKSSSSSTTASPEEPRRHETPGAAKSGGDDDDFDLDGFFGFVPAHLSHFRDQLVGELRTLGRSPLVPDLAGRVGSLWGVDQRGRGSLAGWVRGKRGDYPARSILLAALVTASRADRPGVSYANKVLRHLPTTETLSRPRPVATPGSEQNYSEAMRRVTHGWPPAAMAELREMALKRLAAAHRRGYGPAPEQASEALIAGEMQVLVIDDTWIPPSAQPRRSNGEVPA